MNHYAGIDVSLECSSVCVVDASGKILREARVASEPEALIAWFRSSGFEFERIGLEAGPLSQWLFAGMKAAGGSTPLAGWFHRASTSKYSSSPSARPAVPTTR